MQRLPKNIKCDNGLSVVPLEWTPGGFHNKPLALAEDTATVEVESDSGKGLCQHVLAKLATQREDLR
jgi:hypothetical protein